MLDDYSVSGALRLHEMGVKNMAKGDSGKTFTVESSLFGSSNQCFPLWMCVRFQTKTVPFVGCSFYKFNFCDIF